jgi:hypothetical protein
MSMNLNFMEGRCFAYHAIQIRNCPVLLVGCTGLISVAHIFRLSLKRGRKTVVGQTGPG